MDNCQILHTRRAIVLSHANHSRYPPNNVDWSLIRLLCRKSILKQHWVEEGGNSREIYSIGIFCEFMDNIYAVPIYFGHAGLWFAFFLNVYKLAQKGNHNKLLPACDNLNLPWKSVKLLR